VFVVYRRKSTLDKSIFRGSGFENRFLHPC
jgi:hypothetical protein